MSEPEVHTAIGSVFIDSGAFSLYYGHAYDTATKKKDFSYFRGPEFKKYLRSYASFVRKFSHAIDHYASVDVIYHPELSWKSYRFLKDKEGLAPVPVIHHGEGLEYVQRYLDDGCPIIGLGGFGGVEISKSAYVEWVSSVFRLLCPASNEHKPIVQVHGFAMTGWKMLTAFPWWSVDSASWVKATAFGNIYVPRKLHGEFSFDRAPYAVQISDRSSSIKEAGKHFATLRASEQTEILEWLDVIGVPFGAKTMEEGPGVGNHYRCRNIANLEYFKRMAEAMPEWPWAWKPTAYREGFNL